MLPTGTGVWLPAGSMVVMQIHYNLLRGDKPVRAKLNLTTVPASTRLQALSSTCARSTRTCPARPPSPVRCATAPHRWPTWASGSAEGRRLR